MLANMSLGKTAHYILTATARNLKVVFLHLFESKNHNEKEGLHQLRQKNRNDTGLQGESEEVYLQLTF